MIKTIALHLALVVSGWGIVTSLGPRLKSTSDSQKRESFSAPTKTSRPRMDPAGGKRLLERFAREVSPTIASVPGSNADLSFDEKVAQLIARDYTNGGQPTAEGQLEQYRRWAVLGEMAPIVHGSNGPDYSYAFRHGRIEAQEILELLADRLPEHAADPYFPVILYHCLVRQDPGRAESLLAGLTDRERARQHDSLLSGSRPMLSATAPRTDASFGVYDTESFPTFEPDFAMALLANSPWQREAYRRFDRFSVWRTCALRGPSYGQDYLAWLRSLPPSRDRDGAIEWAVRMSAASQGAPDPSQHPSTGKNR